MLILGNQLVQEFVGLQVLFKEVFTPTEELSNQVFHKVNGTKCEIFPRPVIRGFFHNFQEIKSNQIKNPHPNFSLLALL